MLPDLPELILDRVCGQLSYEDVLVLRSTCKGLKQFVDGKQHTKLNLMVGQFFIYRNLFYTNEPIDYPYSLYSADLTIFSSNRFREMFGHVQRMVISTEPPWCELEDENASENASAFDLNSLNCFRALEHLEVEGFAAIQGELNLPELRIAAILFERHYWKEGEPSIGFDCPRLRALKVDHCRPVLTSRTDQLNYLYYGRRSYQTNYQTNHQTNHLQSISSNLRRLSVICLETTGDLLQFFSDLKNGKLIMPSLDQIRLEKCDDFERLDELIGCLKDLKRDRVQIKFFVDDSPIRSSSELQHIADLKEACWLSP